MATSKKEIYIKIKERDGLVCGLCGGSLTTEWALYEAWKAESVHYKRAKINLSLDHIIPKSTIRGEHWWKNLDNLQLAHGTCNTKKGNTI